MEFFKMDTPKFEFYCIFSDTEMIAIQYADTHAIGVTSDYYHIYFVRRNAVKCSQEEFETKFREVFARIREVVVKNDFVLNMTYSRSG